MNRRKLNVQGLIGILAMVFVPLLVGLIYIIGFSTTPVSWISVYSPMEIYLVAWGIGIAIVIISLSVIVVLVGLIDYIFPKERKGV